MGGRSSELDISHAGMDLPYIYSKINSKIIIWLDGRKATLTLRIKIIEEILHKQISWFDREDRAPGIITNIIASNIASLNGMTSEVLVTVFEVVCVAFIGIIVSLWLCW